MTTALASRRDRILDSGKRYLEDHGIPFDHVEFVAFDAGRFDGLCYVFFTHPDETGAIARSLRVKIRTS